MGLNCKYNGKNNYNIIIEEMLKDYNIIPICPEIMGGLPTPRNQSEIKNDKVITIDGKNVTENFNKGANEVLFLAKKYNIKKAFLKSKSPSCGNGKIYDGTFTNTLVNGFGITAKLLKDNNIDIITID